MAESVVHIGENSPEHVAYRLMMDVFRIEKKASGTGLTREEVLNTYVECLRAVRGSPYEKVKA